jgi:hypothetical protein
LYFYILVRHVLLEAGIDDREAADYLAEMFTVFMNARRSRSPIADGNSPMIYVSDLLAALQNATPRQRFLIRSHLANMALFLVGLFPQFIRRRRRRRGAPGIDFYEQVGRNCYQVASAHRLAETYELSSVFCRLSDRFHDTRVALNNLSDRLLTLEDSGFDESMLLP